MLPRAVASLTAGILITGCGANDAGDRIDVEVTADLYSGQENPEWALSESAAEDLVEHIHTVTGMAETRQDHPGLGFRGFLVEGELEGLEGAEVRVVADGLSVDHGDELLWMPDGGTAFEIIVDDLDAQFSAAEREAIQEAGD
ncbi:hypothetical protein [Bogoriella caseilytica]|uniref:Uncharacterized protein n=1 Tax=Bogoriella caseilytica TaxID=56055 RepID=A0A3N2BCT9_9MICO|nr:hypothetical protein [Bogoriella caseilytica]ROR73076.1 hypothetical protein EDD31_1442 [Bogoriella caseilytica]